MPAQLQQMLAALGAAGPDGLNSLMLGQQSQSMDRQEKRKLMNEIKDEMKIMITQISDYQVEQAVTIVKTQLRQMQAENELDKKRIVERFETELSTTKEFFKKQVTDVRNDF